MQSRGKKIDGRDCGIFFGGVLLYWTTDLGLPNTESTPALLEAGLPSEPGISSWEVPAY